MNEVIRAVSNFLFLLCKDLVSTKSTKNHKKTQKRNQAKAQNANKRTKIKNALKKHLSGK